MPNIEMEEVDLDSSHVEVRTAVKRRVTTANTFRLVFVIHGMYYRRNKCSLAFTIIMPPIFAALVSLIIYAITEQGPFASLTRERKAAAVNFMQWSREDEDNRQPILLSNNGGLDVRIIENPAHHACDNNTSYPTEIQQTLTCSCYMAYALQGSFSMKNHGTIPSQTTTHLDPFVLRSMVYFPNDTRTRDFVENMWEIYENALPDFVRQNSTNVYPLNCTNNKDFKFKGFDSKQDAEDFSKTIFGNFDDPYRGGSFFAIADLSKIDKNQFTLLNSSSQSKSDHIGASYLIQSAILQSHGYRPLKNLTIVKLPDFTPGISLHVIERSEFLRSLLPSLLTAIIAVSGLSMSVDLIVQLVHEKESGFQAFLVSIGISPMFVALTWIVTGIIIGVFTTIVEFVVLVMNSVLSTINLPSLFFILLLYNLSQLSMALFFSTLLKTRNHVIKLLLIILVLSIIASVVVVQSPDTFTGPTLAKKRAISLIPAVNVKTAIDYILQWKLSLYKNVQTSKLACSPFENDESSALAECIAFLLFDIALFLLLASAVTFASPIFTAWKQRNHKKEIVQTSVLSRAAPLKGIVLEDISKTYGNTQALSEISTHFPEGQITILLGENGAGKSTTMDIIAGLLEPTSGHVRYDGQSLRKNKAAIQNSLSYLPQADMFYPYLTLREHILLFGRVRGLQESEIKSIIDREAAVFDLTSSLQVMGNRLSGGQKRKLGLMISYIIDPKYIILDEVTTGVDPYSARAIWAAILAKRGTATTIISTHNMDEAEALADHIIVLSQGANCASGTPMSLKDDFGSGFEVVVSAANMDADERKELEETVVKHVPEVKISTSTGDVSFKVPKSYFESPEMVVCLKSLEDVFAKYGKGSYGINEPNLQQVFFSVTQKHTSEEFADNQDSTPVLASPKTGFLLVLTQILSLLYKRLIQTISSPLTVLFQVIVPILFIVICTASPSATMKTFTYTTEITLKRCYCENEWFYGANYLPNNQQWIDAIMAYGISGSTQKSIPKLTPGKEPVFTVKDMSTTANCIEEGVGKSCQSYGTWSKTGYNTSQDGSRSYEISENNQEFLKVWLYGANQSYPLTVTFGVLFSNNETEILSPAGSDVASVNVLMSNFLLSQDAKSSPIIQSMEKTQQPNLFTVAVSLAFSIAFLALAILYSVSDCQAAIAQDGDTGLKQFMFTTELPAWVYWLTNLTYDLLLSIATIAILTAIVATTSEYPGAAFATAGIVSAVALIAWTYLANALVENRSIASKVVQAGTSAIWIIVLIYFPVIQLYHMVKGSEAAFADLIDGGVFGTLLKVVGYVLYILRLIPAAVLSEFVVLLPLRIADENRGGISRDYFNKVFYREIVGEAIAASCLYLMVLILAEQFNVFKLLCRVKGRAATASPPNRPNDPDVTAEEVKVQTSFDVMPIAAIHLLKKFPRMPIPSVDDVTFGVNEKECFGLLGLNGAGKTTTFRMILGLENPTRGQSYVQGTSVQANPSKTRKILSYCAQNFTICDYLTVEQHIKTFAAIQGQTSRAYLENTLASIGLEKYRNVKVGNLSGGNKKKVQFMCALMADPKVLFLDEPTSGMDPAAQRQLWQLVKAQISEGTSVLLTSHNMFECENLCDRITVMVKGQLRCIGTIQYLKNKLGNRYTVRLRFPVGRLEENERTFQACLDHKALPVFKHSTGLAYEIDAREVGRVSRIFEAVENCRENCGLQGFSVGQLSLENVFVAMAERM